MERALSDFIDNIGSLSDIRNLDNNNPIIFTVEKPGTAEPFLVAGSIREPSYLGVPINLTWVVLDPNSPYYRKALKLKAKEDAVTSGIEDAITDVDFVSSWIIESTYAEIFADAQYMSAGVGPKGDKGDPGDPGDPGEKGDTGPQGDTVTAAIDYSLIVNQVTAQVSNPEAIPISGLNIIGLVGAITAGNYDTFGVRATGPNAGGVLWYGDLSNTLLGSGLVLDISAGDPTGITLEADPGNAPNNFHMITDGPSFPISRVVTVRASWTHPTQGPFSAQQSVTINPAAAPAVRPYYGLITNLDVIDGNILNTMTNRGQLPGSAASVTGSFTLDGGSPGSNLYMAFAYPKSYGFARFEDASAPGFYGGWDGAKGNPSDPGLMGPVEVIVGGVAYYVYRTDFDGLGSTTWNVTPLP